MHDWSLSSNISQASSNKTAAYTDTSFMKMKQHTWLVLAGVRLNDSVVEPHVSDGHPVLGQSSSLVGADGRRRSEGFDGFQMLHQAVLAGHSLGGQGQAHLKDTSTIQTNEFFNKTNFFIL